MVKLKRMEMFTQSPGFKVWRGRASRTGTRPSRRGPRLQNVVIAAAVGFLHPNIQQRFPVRSDDCRTNNVEIIDLIKSSLTPRNCVIERVCE